MNMFFWTFEARHNPDTAPLVLYLGGGPGEPLVDAVFNLGGPCLTDPYNETTTLDPYSFNEHANVLYIDQPIGVGFSYGLNPIYSTDIATQYIWKFLQAFLADSTFERFKSREFGIATISYGGHTAPSLGQEILNRNADIAAGTQFGSKINLTSVFLQSAMMDGGIQGKSSIEFAYHNTYRPLINKTTYWYLRKKYETFVQPDIDICHYQGSMEACNDAYDAWNEYIDQAITNSSKRLYKDWETGSVYDIRPNRPYSIDTGFDKYVRNTTMLRKIGAEGGFGGDAGYVEILATGDEPRSFVPELGVLLDAGVRVVMATGDADYQCNWLGTHDVADAIQWRERQTWQNSHWHPYDVGGVQKGAYKSVKNLGFVKVFHAGHDIALSQPETVLQIFEEMLMGKLGLT